VYSPAELRSIFVSANGVKELRHLVPLVAFTLTRSNEARGAQWSEFDFERKMWTVPPERSKDRRAHMIPLSTGALGVLSVLRNERRIVNMRAGAASVLFAAPNKTGYADQPEDWIKPGSTASGLEDCTMLASPEAGGPWLR